MLEALTAKSYVRMEEIIREQDELKAQAHQIEQFAEVLSIVENQYQILITMIFNLYIPVTVSETYRVASPSEADFYFAETVIEFKILQLEVLVTMH